MNKELIFRILGSIASALIIVSLFIPYVNVYNNTQNLWDVYNKLDSAYLPIMILVFGAIGIVFFALNIKTEMAYMTSGAIIFFSIMQTFEALDSKSFEYLSVGYYCLFIGAIITGLMAFLTNLKSKEKIDTTVSNNDLDKVQVFDQINRLYDGQENIEQNEIKPVDNVINPLPIQPVLTKEVEVQPEVPVEVQNQVVTPINSANIQPVNPVIQEFSTPTNNNVNVQRPVQQESIVNQNEAIRPQQVNPVMQEFNRPESPVFTQNTVPQQQASVNQTNGVDIFGQPINK